MRHEGKLVRASNGGVGYIGSRLVVEHHCHGGGEIDRHQAKLAHRQPFAGHGARLVNGRCGEVCDLDPAHRIHKRRTAIAVATQIFRALEPRPHDCKIKHLNHRL
jgi:hypothetical protein